jgi:hypothetical protein
MTILTVGASGSYQTIRAAVEAAAPGDVIEVANGVYRESIALDKPGVMVVAMEGHQPEINGGYGPELFGAAGYTTRIGAALKPNQLPYPTEDNARRGNWVIARDQSAIVRLMADDTVFKGFIIRNVCGRGYRVYGKGAKLQDCIIDFTYSGSGICDGDDNEVSGCTITRGSMKYFDPTVDNGKGTQTCIMTKGRNALIKNNRVAYHFGEGVGADKQSRGTRIIGNEIHTCLHWESGMNEANGAVWEGNILYWPENLIPAMGKASASDLWVAGNEQEDEVMSAGPTFIGNLLIGGKEGLAVSNGQSGRPISFVGARFQRNTFIGTAATRYLITWGTYKANPHKDVEFSDNVILKHPAAAEDVKLFQGGGDVRWHHNLSNCELPEALRGEGDIVTAAQVLANPFAEIRGQFNYKMLELPDVGTTLDLDNYRPVAGSLALVAGSDGGRVGALGLADEQEPPDPPDDPGDPPDGDPPVLDIQAVINHLAGVWGKMGESNQRFNTALDTFNEALYIAGVARDDLKQLMDWLQGPQGQGDKHHDE